MTIKSMRAKYPGHCSRSGARINPGDDIKFDTITRRAWLEEPGDSRVVFYGENGPSTFSTVTRAAGAKTRRAAGVALSSARLYAALAAVYGRALVRAIT